MSVILWALDLEQEQTLGSFILIGFVHVVEHSESLEEQRVEIFTVV